MTSAGEPSTPPSPDKLTMSISETAVALGVCEASAYAAVKRGDLPHLKIGNRILIPVAEFRRWLEARIVGSASGGR